MPCAVSSRHSFRALQKKKLLILDLNGVLADINNDQHSSIWAAGRVRGKLGKYLALLSPIPSICTDADVACNERC